MAYAASANEWVAVEADKDQTVLVDRANVRELGEGVRETWVQFSYKKKSSEGATSSIGLFHFARNPDRLRNVQDTLLDAAGNTVYFRRPEKLEDWSPIPPGSLGQKVIEFVYSVQPASGAGGE